MEQQYVQRKMCPFYGFMTLQCHLRDTGGNECIHSPGIGWNATCWMEEKEGKVDFTLCSVIDSEFKKRIIEGNDFKDMWVYPKEFPEGIPFRDWMDYVMKPQKRPSSD